MAARRSANPEHNYDHIVPIPLRPDLIVRVANLPHDLTEAEAQKIVAVLMAHVWRPR